MLLRQGASDPSPASSSGYRTAPLPTRGPPPGITHIIVNECAERFSFYGMKAILTIYLTKHLGVGESTAREYYHAFTTAVYFFPLGGALMAEVFFGKYNVVISFSLVYCLGHLALAQIHSRGSSSALLSSPWVLVASSRGGVGHTRATNLVRATRPS